MIKSRLFCLLMGHTPSGIITGFTNSAGRAIGRCARCGVPIVLQYSAAPYLFAKYQQAMEAASNQALDTEAQKPAPRSA